MGLDQDLLRYIFGDETPICKLTRWFDVHQGTKWVGDMVYQKGRARVLDFDLSHKSLGAVPVGNSV